MIFGFTVSVFIQDTLVSTNKIAVVRIKILFVVILSVLVEIPRYFQVIKIVILFSLYVKKSGVFQLFLILKYSCYLNIF